MMLNRRNWILGAGLSAASTFAQTPRSVEQVGAASRFIPSSELCFRPQDFGARADGATLDTASMQSAIDAAHGAGGGTVYFSTGTYLCGTLLLRSHVSLWLDNGATLLMSSKSEDFLSNDSQIASREYGTNESSYALLLGDKIESVRVYGEGAIESNRKRRGGPKPVFLRNCRNITLSGITFRDAPDYTVSLYLCSCVLIEGLTIFNGYADGIDLDCCKQIRVIGCMMESIDDSLCLKATQLASARGVTEQISISDCVLRTASIHFKCGTESYGDFRDIVVSNCIFEGGMGLRHGNPGIALYTVDGGNLESVSISNIVMRNVATPFAILLGDRDAWHLERGPGWIRDVSISHVIASEARFASVIAGIPNRSVEGIRFSDITLRMQPTKVTDKKTQNASGETLADADPFAVIEQPKHYPEPTMFGPLPASVLYMRHAKDVELRNLQCSFEEVATFPAIVGDDLERLRMELSLTNEASSVWLRDVRDSFVDVVSLGSHLRSQLKFSGRETMNVFCRVNGSFDRKSQIVLDPELPSNGVEIL